MKKNLVIKRLIKVSAFCLIFVMLFSYSYKIFSWKDGVGGYSSASITLYEELDDNIVDVLFLGSSHCFASISNTQLWDDYGMGAFNMVVSGQDMASTYYHMDEVFKTQSPKVVCVELYGITFENHAVTANIYRNTLSMKYSKNFLDLVEAIVPEEDKKDYLLKWPIIHTRYRELEKRDFVDNSPAYLGGDASNSRITDLGQIDIYQGTDVTAISDKNQMYVQKIIDLAKENDAQLCFFIVPYEAGEETQKQFKYIQKYVNDQSIPVINMFEKYDEIGFDAHTDFSDNGHTNEYGAKKITSYMGDYLKKNYDIPNRSGDDRYYLWEENSIAFERELINQNLTTIYTFSEYLNTLYNLDGYTVAFVTNGDPSCSEINVSEELIKLGIDPSLTTDGGAVVISNNEILFNSSDKEFLFYTDLLNHTLAVKREDETNILRVDKRTYYSIDNGIHVLVYDNVLGQIADFVGFNASNKYKGNRI